MIDFEPYLPPRSAPRAARRGTAAEALSQIPDGARVVLPALSGTPLGLLGALDDLRSGWTDIELACGNLQAHIAPLDHPGEPFRFSSYQPSAPLRAAEAAGRLQHIPASYAQVPSLFAQDGPLPAAAVLVQVSPPGAEGRHSLGTSVGGIVDVIRTAPLVIGQINAAVPYTFGAAELEPEEFDWLVELESALPQLRRAAPGAVELQIAEHVVSLVPDGATLQFGLGGVPEAIMGLLGARRDLGVHSGLISDGIMGLLESGALTGARKETAPGPIITTEAAGSAEFYRWLHRNEAVRLAPAGIHSLAAGVGAAARLHRDQLGRAGGARWLGERRDCRRPADFGAGRAARLRGRRTAQRRPQHHRDAGCGGARAGLADRRAARRRCSCHDAALPG